MSDVTPCRACNGRSAITVKCPNCDGSGIDHPDGEAVECRHCEGFGEVAAWCAACDGTGSTNQASHTMSEDPDLLTYEDCLANVRPQWDAWLAAHPEADLDMQIAAAWSFADTVTPFWGYEIDAILTAHPELIEADEDRTVCVTRGIAHALIELIPQEVAP